MEWRRLCDAKWAKLRSKLGEFGLQNGRNWFAIWAKLRGRLVSESSSGRWNVSVVWLITECFFYFSVVCVYVYCDFIARFR